MHYLVNEIIMLCGKVLFMYMYGLYFIGLDDNLWNLPFTFVRKRVVERRLELVALLHISGWLLLSVSFSAWRSNI